MKGEKTESFDNVLSARGCKKAADFVKFCDAFENSGSVSDKCKGYKATKCSEANIAKMQPLSLLTHLQMQPYRR